MDSGLLPYHHHHQFIKQMSDAHAYVERKHENT